ncbi:hypothetical protein RF11_15201 [Thelohanellus kitauei]|uniref:Uncharacterized protein n=1 Tax=Thelohanellus kitauei TaxID=669202 RepID=A0A0C2NFB3_THEKT|nr:hypothetical protein RF11_15201 [Thelohanellus kitauei]
MDDWNSYFKQPKSVTDQDNRKMFEEWGFNPNDGYDYSQHFAPVRDPNQECVVLSCGEDDDLPTLHGNNDMTDTIMTQIYTDSEIGLYIFYFLPILLPCNRSFIILYIKTPDLAANIISKWLKYLF